LPSTIEQLHREYGDKGLLVLAINIGERRDVVARYVRDRRITMPILLDPAQRSVAAYAVTVTPTAIVVGRDGRLVARALGPKPWTSDKGRALIDAVLRSVS
jgi:hypothetical protein